MLCCSRSTFGVIIGIINILCCIGLIIIAIISLFPPNELERQKTMSFNKQVFIFILIIVLSTIAATFAGLMITGIAKKRHELMTPWLLLNGAGFVVNCGHFVLQLFDILASANFFSIAFVFLFVNLLGLAISALILWTIFSLYDEIRLKNNENSGRILKSDAGIEY